MTQTEVMGKAASLFVEWKEGDEFERLYNDNDPNNYQTIPPEQVLEMLQNGYHVRLKPKPVRRLLPTWQIFKLEEDRLAMDIYHQVSVDLGDECVTITELWEHETHTRHEIGKAAKNWPDSWFETVDPTTSSARSAAGET